MTPAPLPTEEIERLRMLLAAYVADDGHMLDYSAHPALHIEGIRALPALLAEIEAGRAGAERVREVPVKHLSTQGPFYARAMAWWAANNMKSEAKVAFVTGDGYIRYSWDDGEESGSYSLPIARLYGLPHEDGILRQAAQPAPATFADGIREAAAVADRFAEQARDDFEAAAGRDISAGIRSLAGGAAQLAPACSHGNGRHSDGDWACFDCGAIIGPNEPTAPTQVAAQPAGRGEDMARAHRAIEALRKPDISLVQVPNAIRQSIVEVIEGLLATPPASGAVDAASTCRGGPGGSPILGCEGGRKPVIGCQCKPGAVDDGEIER